MSSIRFPGSLAVLGRGVIAGYFCYWRRGFLAFLAASAIATPLGAKETATPKHQPAHPTSEAKHHSHASAHEAKHGKKTAGPRVLSAPQPPAGPPVPAPPPASGPPAT